MLVVEKERQMVRLSGKIETILKSSGCTDNISSTSATIFLVTVAVKQRSGTVTKLTKILIFR